MGSCKQINKGKRRKNGKNRANLCLFLFWFWLLCECHCSSVDGWLMCRSMPRDGWWVLKWEEFSSRAKEAVPAFVGKLANFCVLIPTCKIRMKLLLYLCLWLSCLLELQENAGRFLEAERSLGWQTWKLPEKQGFCLPALQDCSDFEIPFLAKIWQHQEHRYPFSILLDPMCTWRSLGKKCYLEHLAQQGLLLSCAF